MMMHPDERPLERKGKSLSRPGAHHQGLRQTGSNRGGDHLNLGRSDLRLFKRSAGSGEKIPKMFPGGQLRHDAAVLGVELDLGSNDVGQHATGVDHRHTGFVAGRLDCEQQTYLPFLADLRAGFPSLPSSNIALSISRARSI
jgi:hypothetical protein